MADSNLPLSPDVMALVRARAAATHSDPSAVADEILRLALEPAAVPNMDRAALNRRLNAAYQQAQAGETISEEELFAELDADTDA